MMVLEAFSLLSIPAARHVASNALAFAVRAPTPVAPGHTLIAPRRLVARWVDARPDERAALWKLVDVVRADLQRLGLLEGFQVSLDDGPAAGRPIPHLHLHVIPRRDCAAHFAAEGGLTHAPYLARPAPLATGGADDPFLHHLAHPMSRAKTIDILAAFVRASGVTALADRLGAALDRGARVRVLTGDYLHITQAEALYALLDLVRSSACDEDALQVRVIEIERLASARTFHPKAWLLTGANFTTAFVGSSNLSRAALYDGVEWNLRVDERRDAFAVAAIRSAYEALWRRARPVDEAWLQVYADSARDADLPLPPGEADAPEDSPPVPRDVQVQALDALTEARAAGRMRALVVMATGLGKTWLAAFDVNRWREETGRAPRVLLVAHRRELLKQAAETFRQLFPTTRTGWFVGPHAEREGEILFASVQKLARPEHLATFAPDRFDYVIIDEVHHAAAESYLRLLDHFRPAFLLGLTATPERADDGDIFQLFDGETVFEADIGVGIRRGHLVPFAYRGLKDTADYAPIPWKNYRFDPDMLATAVETRERMETLLRAWQEHPGERSLVFCCSIQHARFVTAWLGERDIRCVAVHSEPDSYDRVEALEALTRGELDAICAVDLFNEGIDLPLVDRVVMLRPTGSSVVFLQQLGRGLRIAPGKDRLIVLDFVGNHRVFLDRLRTLLALAPGERAPSLRELMARGALELPGGCSVEIEIEAVDLLREFLPTADDDPVVQAYRERKAARGVRPTPGALARSGFNPAARRLQQAFGGWLGFVREEGDLSAGELIVLGACPRLFRALESTASTAACLLFTALLDIGFPGVSPTRDELHAAFQRRLVRAPRLASALGGEAVEADALAVWARCGVVSQEGDPIQSRLALHPGDLSSFEGLVRELLDWRLFRARQRTDAPEGGGFSCKLLTNKRHPIIKLPSRKQHPDLPSGDLDARLPDGRWWTFRFAKQYINVAYPVSTSRNALPTLLRDWFSEHAGQPGTEHRVRFFQTPDGWGIEPMQHAPPSDHPERGASATEVRDLFQGLSQEPAPPLSRVDGQLFLLVGAPGDALSPAALRPVGEATLSEEAWALRREGDTWRYLGQARREAEQWSIPELDFAGWRSLRSPGKRKGVTRPLPVDWLARTRDFVEQILTTPGPGGVICRGSKQLHVLGVADRGGLRVDMPKWRKPRTISLIDLGWVLFTQARATGPLDDALVNRYRYLEGTPRGSTRWIDTGHALTLVLGTSTLPST